MLFGGAFLCFEGVEKLVEAWHRRRHPSEAHAPHPASGDATEAARIRGAIRTDLILSAEIVVISLGAVGEESFAVRALTLCGVAIIATVGIYGFVAGIVKLDDLGLVLQRRRGVVARAASTALLRAAPLLMRALSVIGTIAVFLVGGGIVTHSIERMKKWSAHVELRLHEVDGVGQFLTLLWSPLFDAFVGVLLGALSVLLVSAGRRFRSGVVNAGG
jgi:predicted DNA repair protein MutK